MLWQRPKFSFSSLSFKNERFHFGLGESVFLSHARNGIFQALELIKREDERRRVLAPASICSVAIAPIINQGYEILYYDIDDQFNPVLNENLDLTNVSIFLYVNFFGLSSSAQKVREFCNQHQIYMIEDCALTMPSSDQSQIGKIGDFSIFSLRKFLPIPDGAVLVCNNEQFNLNNIGFNNQSFKEEVKQFISFMVILLKPMLSSFLKFKYKKIQLSKPLKNYEDLDLSFQNYSKRISKISRHLLKFISIKKYIEERNTIFQSVVRSLDKSKVQVLIHESNKDAIAYIVPVRLENRDNILESLYREGLFLEPSLNEPFVDNEKIIKTNDSYAELRSKCSSFIGIPTHRDILSHQIHVKEILCQ
ncbi:DegT/DnrJ/EryC1/StrS family aminotransferase [Halobacteriovorax sp. GB3]|uniref:DegT/DnrJ/EryC1/StrS family aminotransferase n=1 Tax=Halobacteriovorax sp. GB3 TaxID=2719615 RepID=UPI002361D750|nr:DegT/DnrJ/EryC1/StrS family aminotransferase [Halobacteriovorax sp. GB3]MDD0852515.1 DegT/DnrJ/EryC1/StrS family aminotransferase [Halobacteriovorax sp. GB3]